MRKWLTIMCAAVILSQLLAGCSAGRSVEFKEFYSEVLGFSPIDQKAKPVQQDALLMVTGEDFQKFMDEYFTPREIPIGSPGKEKAVLYLQIPPPASTVDDYSVQSIGVKNNTVTVNLEKLEDTTVNADGPNMSSTSWKWVMFIEMDKTGLKDNMKIVINK